MSEEKLSIVSNILNNITNPNNEIRTKSANMLEELRKDSPSLVACLIKILYESTIVKDKVVASVLIRKILEIKDDVICSPIWKNISSEDQSNIRYLSLQCLEKENNFNLISKITECVIQIALNSYNCTNTENYSVVWPELLNYVSKCFELNISQTNDNDYHLKTCKIESALRIFESIYEFIYLDFNTNDKLKPILDVLTSFTNSNNSITLRAKAVKSLCEISFYLEKKQLKLYKDIVFTILEVTYSCLNNNKENELKICLKSIIEMTNESSAYLFKKNFSDMFILMGKISEKNDYDDNNIKELGFEVIVNLIEVKTTLFSSDKDKLKVFVESLIKYAINMDDDITEEWSTPTQLSYFDMEHIMEKEVSCTISFLERLIGSLSNDIMLPLLSEYVAKLITNTNDWRYKYLAIFIFKLVIGYVDDMVEVSNLFPTIFECMNDNNPKIRFASLNTIEELADHFQPYFGEKYFKTLVDPILSKFSDNILKVQLEATESLNTMISYSGDVEGNIIPYTQKILDYVFNIFLKDNIANNLRECILNVLSGLICEVGDKITPYSTKIYEILWKFFVESYKGKVHKAIYGNILECITTVGPYVGPEYSKNINDLVNVIIDIQNNSKMDSDPIRPYIEDSIKSLINFLKDNNKDLIPKLIESVLNLVKTMPEMSLSSNPDQEFKIEDLISNANEDPSEIKIAIDSNIKTTSTEEMASALETLNKVIESLGEMFLPYIEVANKEIIYNLTYPLNDCIRQLSSDCMTSIISIVKKFSNQESLINIAKYYTVEMMIAIEKEEDNETLCYILENLGLIIETAEEYLNKEEVNDLFNRLLKVFDKVEQGRIKLLEKKSNLENIINDKKLSQLNKKSKGNNNADDDEDSYNEEEHLEKDVKDEIEEIQEILSEMTNVIGVLFASHKKNSEYIINTVVNNMIPKYFRTNASSFENKMGLYLIDDIIEFLGQEAIGNNLWNEMIKALITFSSNNECDLRQASLYGIGVFAKETKQNFENYSNSCLESIFKAINIASDNYDENDWTLARENAIAALGKIIKYQRYNKSININQICPKWLSYLPINKDKSEIEEQHQLLCDIVLNNREIIFGEYNTNCPNILRCLAKIYKNNNLSNVEIDSKIEQIFSIFINDNNLNKIYQELINSEIDSKIKKKLLLLNK